MSRFVRAVDKAGEDKAVDGALRECIDVGTFRYRRRQRPATDADPAVDDSAPVELTPGASSPERYRVTKSAEPSVGAKGLE